MSVRWPACLLALFCVVVVVDRASAQRTTGAIIGTVSDESGALLPGVSVSIAGSAIPGRPTIVTTDAGRYQFLALPPGSYELAFLLNGFTTLTHTDVVVSVGTTMEIDVALKVSPVAESVTVKGENPVVNSTSSQVTNALAREWLRAAPTSRSYHELLRFGQGVNVGTSAATVAFNVFGSGVNDNQFQLDGADQTTSHAANTAPAVFPNPEILEEVELLALGAPAEYGSFMGGVFNAVTRQGGNRFSGDATAFVQTNGMTGRNTGDAIDNGRPFTRDRFHDVSFQLGGPILRDRLWFFGSYQHFEDFFSQVGADPLFPSGTRIERGFAKLTYQASPAHRLTVSLNPSAYENVASGSAFEDATTINRGPQKGFTPAVVWNATLSPRTALEVRANYYYSNYTAQPPEGEPEVKTRFVALDTGRVTGGVLLVGESIYRKATVTGKVTHFTDRFLGGSHDLRLGVQYQKGTADNSFFYNDLVYTIAGRPQNGYIQVQSAYGANPDQTGIFVDDSFRPHRRVTIDAGLRYDHSHIGSPAFPEYDRRRQRTGGEFSAVSDLITWNTVSPRVGFNLKLDEAGKSIVKGHYGRYFQSLNIAAALYRVLPSASPRYAFSGEYDASGEPIGLTPISVASNRRMDEDVGAPRTDQYVLGVERQLTNNVGLSVHFVHKRGGHYMAWQDVGGIYEPAVYLDTVGREPTGDSIDVFRLTGPSADRFFLLTDPDQMFSRYRGLTVAVNKRLSDGWFLSSSLTWSKSTGRLVSSNAGPASPQNSAPIFSSFGQNPNDFVRSDALLIADRPILWKTQFLVNLPLGISAATSYQYSTGRPWGRTVRVNGLGLTTTIRAERLEGERRLDDLHLLDLRLEKEFMVNGPLRIAAFGDVLNMLNRDAFENIASTLGTSDVFGTPTMVQVPRRLTLGARVRF